MHGTLLVPGQHEPERRVVKAIEDVEDGSTRIAEKNLAARMNKTVDDALRAGPGVLFLFPRLFRRFLFHDTFPRLLVVQTQKPAVLRNGGFLSHNMKSHLDSIH